MKKTSIIFDMYGTLYDLNRKNFFSKIRENGLKLLKKEYGYDVSDSVQFLDYLKEEYNGDISVGFEEELNLPVPEYFKKVWNVNPTKYVNKDPFMEKALNNIVLDKILLTNAPKIWADNVLEYLNIKGYFKKIITAENGIKKPQKKAYNKAIIDLGISPLESFFVDDEIKNIRAAGILGLTTIYKGDDKNYKKELDYSISDLGELEMIIFSDTLINKQSNTFSQLYGGEKNCKLFKFKTSDDERVLKIAKLEDSGAANEIDKNYKGYTEMIENRISFIAPKIFEYNENDSFKWIIISYEGSSLTDVLMREVNKTGEVIDKVIKTLDRVYDKVLIKNPELSEESIKGVSSNIKKYLNNYLIPYELVCRESLNSFSNFMETVQFPDYVSFATTDLTPDNILFNSENQVKFIDPKESILGNNLIDLGMFSTIYCDIYNLPSSNEVRSRIRKLAEKQGESMKINSELTKTLFNLGKLRQYTLSARFRYGKSRSGMSSEECADNFNNLLLNG